jgi:hypothetical protein
VVSKEVKGFSRERKRGVYVRFGRSNNPQSCHHSDSNCLSKTLVFVKRVHSRVASQSSCHKVQVTSEALAAEKSIRLYVSASCPSP